MARTIPVVHSDTVWTVIVLMMHIVTRYKEGSTPGTFLKISLQGVDKLMNVARIQYDTSCRGN